MVESQAASSNTKTDQQLRRLLEIVAHFRHLKSNSAVKKK